jgi:4-hydroxy-tetrahydrodipicolinate reductase
MRLLLFGADGRVGSVLTPALAQAGHEVTGIERGQQPSYDGHDAAVDFTRPDAVRPNVEGCLGAGLPTIVGTTGIGPADLAAFDALARDREVPCFVAPNFAVGAVLMMRFAAEAARYLPRAEIVELHAETKVDAPSGTARATAQAMMGEVPIHSVRLPGLVAHQEVLLGGPGQVLTIRHDTTSREAFVPGVLLALEKLHALPSGVTVGLEALLDPA